eukprot:CAMPEP_0169281308 /NCGR_PEP_ID=MMETSP1016-20121227/56156_1 /TAXON_ID=342587 /ORGANISM="Karlodinium micrum, Strain CCMP2283" /LENGTH=129 /DNA_ID=CAMNT_0009369861 /DNA_START=86 /DNA_END=475 /DNA_ORIENTATION=+
MDADRTDMLASLPETNFQHSEANTEPVWINIVYKKQEKPEMFSPTMSDNATRTTNDSWACKVSILQLCTDNPNAVETASSGSTRCNLSSTSEFNNSGTSVFTMFVTAEYSRQAGLEKSCDTGMSPFTYA